MEQKKLEEAKEAITKSEINFVSIGENKVAEALSTLIECIDRVTELEKENAELRKLIKEYEKVNQECMILSAEIANEIKKVKEKK